MTEASGRAGLTHQVLDVGNLKFSLNSGSLRRPPEELIRASARAGFAGIELWSRDCEDEGAPERLRAVLGEERIEVSSFQLLRDYEGAPLAARTGKLGEAERLMEQMSRIGAELLLVCANTAPDSSGDRKDMVRDLRCLADMAQARNMRITFEPLAWSRWLKTYEAATECIEQADHPALGMTIDMFHWFWNGTPTAFSRQLPMAKCFQLQLCDAVPSGLSAIETARKHRLFPGEGNWPVAELVRNFRDLGFTGYCNIEVFNEQYMQLPTETFIEKAVASVNAL